MIEEIRIRDLGVITDATLDLGPGFTVVTGETGAGKTMVITALGLLLGARSDAGAVRIGAKSAVAEALVHVDPRSPAAVRAGEAGAELEEYDGAAELTLVRTVNADGRSRAHVGGRSAPVGVLAEVGEHLVVVHGQTDQLRLKSAAAQREALDKYAGAPLAAELGAYREDYARWRAAAKELSELRDQARDRLREAEYLTAALEEIEAVDPQPGEDDSLKAEAMRLSNLEELRTAAVSAHAALIADDFADGGDATSLVDAAKRQLESAGEHDPALAASGQRLAEVGYILADIATELASYGASLDSEGPERLAEVESRRADLAGLVRKYAPSIDGVLEWSGESAKRLAELSSDDSRIDALEAEIGVLAERLATRGAALTKLRTDAAAELAQRVSDELTALAMKDANLVIEVEPTGEPGPHGADSISFLLAPHPGAPARPLGKGASGGELSRVMLAIEVVLAAVDPVPTFIFDEVDAGVGGKAAVEIGRRLAMLAKHVQVIVVTHLPQVAAFADHHIRVIKTSTSTDDGTGVTASDVRVLGQEERIKELARMLAGQEDSASARAHAEELLDSAGHLQ
ncbi:MULTISPECIES: DNA repair protein RecN [unclassified Arthrobacter]|uniref:DNA repair protein RecN n=1 Tax=unclassified Arthrobacter TaxID=235627 RepID=UPI001E3CD809|nr:MULTISPECIES: DNA repair protein RecN [unclassified Arthrobacter]MCC9144978.1 DNA repair protein RecN [Arthrobacter sp. zg-Y919]MDK1276206.1 DNA repair protein RecN [Arthrobacter sp. zg.Y919]WIB02181.1 DNA repair protein RecN [Arthrobacter sp. zg-Y919]